MLSLILEQNPKEPIDNKELFPAQFSDVEIIFLLYTLDFTVLVLISLLAKIYIYNVKLLNLMKFDPATNDCSPRIW